MRSSRMTCSRSLKNQWLGIVGKWILGCFWVPKAATGMFFGLDVLGFRSKTNETPTKIEVQKWVWFADTSNWRVFCLSEFTSLRLSWERPLYMFSTDVALVIKKLESSIILLLPSSGIKPHHASSNLVLKDLAGECLGTGLGRHGQGLWYFRTSPQPSPPAPLGQAVPPLEFSSQSLLILWEVVEKNVKNSSKAHCVPGAADWDLSKSSTRRGGKVKYVMISGAGHRNTWCISNWSDQVTRPYPNSAGMSAVIMVDFRYPAQELISWQDVLHISPVQATQIVQKPARLSLPRWKKNAKILRSLLRRYM